MVTPDKDYGQLVSEHIRIYKPGYQGSDAEILGVTKCWSGGASRM
jgi:DNA polymerase-1